jgi:hypothetical protein
MRVFRTSRRRKNNLLRGWHDFDEVRSEGIEGHAEVIGKRELVGEIVNRQENVA